MSETTFSTRERFKSGAMPGITDEQLATVDPRQVGRSVLAVLDVLQNFTPHVQAATLACLLYIGSQRFKAHAGNILERGRIIVTRSKAPEFKGAELYCANEIK